MPKRRRKLPRLRKLFKVGDLVTDREYPGEGFGIIIAINDLRTKEPFVIVCDHGTIRMTKKMRNIPSFLVASRR